MNRKKIKILFLLSFFIFVGWLAMASQPAAASVSPAVLSWAPASISAAAGQEFSVDLMLNAAGSDINAVAGRIVFPSDSLFLEKIYDGGSIVTLWVKAPVQETDKSVSFSGIIPGGFNGVLEPYSDIKHPGRILTLIFKTKAAGQGVISLQDVELLLNDGRGTKSEHIAADLNWQAAENTVPESQTAAVSPIEDGDAPEIFSPQLVQDPSLFSGQWFLSFAATDAKSGIDRYEIQESLSSAPAADGWQIAASPYLLQDQARRHYIFIKAIDRAGNDRLIVLPPDNPENRYEKGVVWVIISLLIMIISSISIWRYLRSKKSSR